MLVSSVILFLATLVSVPYAAPSARAQAVGVVCIIETSSNSCPASPATIPGTVGSQLRVAVFIQNSGSLNGFDITLLADHTILKPSGADITGTVLVSPVFLTANCIGGTGTGCSSTDNVDTIHVAAVCIAFPCTPTPTTGLLFTAIYSVVAASAGTPIRFQTGCTASSVSGTTICVIIANGALLVPETAQTAVFTTLPAFMISATPSSLTIAKGSSGTSTVTITSLNGFSGTVTLSDTIAPIVPRGPTASLGSMIVMLASGGTATVTLTVSVARNTPMGSYSVTVTGMAGSQSSSALVSITVVTH